MVTFLTNHKFLFIRLLLSAKNIGQKTARSITPKTRFESDSQVHHNFAVSHRNSLLRYFDAACKKSV